MPIVAHAPQQNGKSSSKSRSGCSTTPATPKKPEMYNQVVKVEGEEASHAPYYFVLHYVPDLHWCHLAAMREDGIFPELTRKGLPHPHAGKKRWRLTPEGESKELDVSADRCTRVPRSAQRLPICTPSHPLVSCRMSKDAACQPESVFFCAGVMRTRVWVRRNGGEAMGAEQCTPKKPEMCNQIVKVEGEEASHAPHPLLLAHGLCVRRPWFRQEQCVFA